MLEVILIILCGLIAFLTINVIGKFMLPKSYQNELFGDEDEKKSFFNVAFRVIAPTIVLSFEGILCKSFIIDFTFVCLIYSCGFYWLLRLLFWVIKRNRIKTRIGMIVCQAICSMGISWYLFNAIGSHPEDVLLPRIDDVSFEFLILTFIVVFYFLSESPLLRKDANLPETAQRLEKKLFAIDKQCRDTLPNRYQEDVSLKTLFYAIALIEDTYRPKTFRLVENTLLRLGLNCIVKTAGLMQVPTQKALSDKESIEIAANRVIKIYDNHLKQSTSYAIDSYCPGPNWSPELTFFDSGYSYNLDAMMNSIGFNFGHLYGKYCGTYKIDVSNFFRETESFIRSQYDENKDRKVEVSYIIPFPWDSLPINGWMHIDKAGGFACFGGEDAARAIKCNHHESHEIIEAIIQSELNGQVLFFYNGLKGGIVLFLEDVDSEKLENLAHALSTSIDIAPYHFNQFIEDPNGFIERLFAEETYG